MAYNGASNRYGQAKHQARPHAYTGHNGYGQGQYPGQADYQTRSGQRYDGYQQEAYNSNQQYSQNYDDVWEQEQNQPQYQAGMNSHPADSEGQPRSYQYDDRYRQNGRQGTPNEGRGGGPAGRRSPQSRPGTSASNWRTKQERILDSAELDSPKAMAWDNPFGVFPGTRKDAEQKKKAADEARSRSRAETPSDRPMLATSSSRPPTSTDSREANRPTMTSQIRNEGRPHTSQSGSTDYVEDTGAFNNQHGQTDNMPLRKMRPPEVAQNFDFGIPPPTIDSNTQSLRQNLPVRPAPQRSASGPTTERQPFSPPAIPATRNAQSPTTFRQNVYSKEDPQEMFRRMKNTYANASHGAAAGQAHQDYQADPREYSQPRLDNTTHREREWQEQSTEQVGTTDDYEYRAMPGAFEYRGVKSSRSMTDLSEPAMPNFAEMPANATENIEKQVTLQSQQPYSAYRKPTYGDASSRPQPQNSAQRVPVRPGLMQDQSQTADNQFEPNTGNYAERFAPTPRYDSARGADAGRNPHGGYRSPPVQYDSPGDPNQQQYPPRKGSRPEARGPGPSPGFRHPYNQPNQGRPGTQYQRSPPGGAPYANQSRSQGRRAPRQEYGFDSQGYPSGNKFNLNPYYEDPAYETYPREQVHSPEQPPHLTRSQTEPVHQPYDDQYDQPYNRRGPPNRTQTFDSGYDHPPSPTRVRRPQQYDQSQAYDQHGYPLPPRPRTANAVNSPVHSYPDQGMSRSRPPNSAFPVADRNHPIPIRPGLMNQAPEPAPTPSAPPAPPAAPVHQVSPPRTQQSSAPQNRGPSGPAKKPPVTAAEISGLRDAFNNRPNDDRLGLQFAKKLVEAASVLANEGGRADPKQTARNRERYINDAYKIVKKLVGNGSSEAMFYLADCHGTGQLGLEVNPKEAFQLYTSAAKMNHPQATYRVAVCCEMGADGGGGTRRDHVKAVQFYKKAATLGDGPAMFKMGAILMKGLLGQQQNRREGIQWLKRAAERADEENPHALHELGSIYENAKSDDVVIKDERYAMELFTKAANLGYKHSQSRLGAAYEYGLMGCPIDPQKSIMWYSKAASQGEHLAEFALSGWYLTGAPPLLEASDQEAYLWARKAASSGLAKAEYAMGYYTETGIGTTPNVEEAKKWYFRAAAQNDDRARNRLEEFKRGAGRKERGRVSRSGVGRQNEGECAVM